MAHSGRDDDRLEREIDQSGFSTLTAAIGFCALGLLAALVVPLVMHDRSGDQVADSNSSGNFDRIITGGISEPKTTKRYTIRKSVMQSDPTKECIIHEDGRQEGHC